jgi:hypothetical protein
MLRIRNPKDFWSGVMFMALGAFAIVVGSHYTLGTAARMGPGYFPRVLGILLMVLGLLITVRGLRVDGPRMPAWKLRPTLLVLGSVVIFGIIVEKLGMALSTIVLIVLSSLASREFSFKSSLISGVFLAALAVGVFVIGLGLQLPIWPGQR